jgi:D-arabinose 1-dehydrogenase-like Zn-dependent alcohol dehydrogenase
MSAPGACAEFRVVHADRLVPVPNDIDDQTTAALFLKGITAEQLLHSVAPSKAGGTILIHAAASGVGQLLTMWAKAIGCTVIGTTSSPAKADLIKNIGADHVIITSQEDIAERVSEIPGGLKNAIDWLVSREEIINKPIALMHTSHRGEVMLEQLRLVISTVSQQLAHNVFIRFEFLNLSSDEISEQMELPANQASVANFLRALTDRCQK